MVFTDGGAKGNPGPGGWGAIVLMPNGTVTELGGGSPHTTNNKMELCGAIAALEAVSAHPGPVLIYTDSTYVIQGITRWVWGWRKRGWKTVQGGDVLNRELWEQLSTLVSARAARNVEWHWVRGHVGTPGNERVDEIATAFAMERPVSLYRGPLSRYSIELRQVPDDTAVPTRSPGSASRAKKTAHSYLSVVDGVVARHLTWPECERRVRGRSGARYKKAMSAADEGAILREWNVTLPPDGPRE